MSGMFFMINLAAHVKHVETGKYELGKIEMVPVAVLDIQMIRDLACVHFPNVTPAGSRVYLRGGHMLDVLQTKKDIWKSLQEAAQGPIPEGAGGGDVDPNLN